MSRSALALVLALAFVAPAASAWTAGGGREPDTVYDRDGGAMFLATDVDPDPGVRQAYFSAVPASPSYTGNGVNPNAGAVGSRQLFPGNTAFNVFLGAWKDCNDDGYVGHAETIVMEYRAELLTNTSVCPSGGEFNDGTWVYEFLWIGNGPAPGDPCCYRYPRMIYDPASRVWGDFGVPGREVHFDCAYAPMPLGTTERTGGLLGYGDCVVAHRGARAVNDVDAQAELGLAFEDPYHPEKDCDHPLNQRVPGNTFGNDPCAPDDTGALEPWTEDRAVTVWDCDGEGTVHDPTGAPGQQGWTSPRNLIYDNDPTGVLVLPGAVDGTVLTDERGYVLPGVNATPAVNPDGSLVTGYDHASRRCRGMPFPVNAAADTLSGWMILEAAASANEEQEGKRQSDFLFEWGTAAFFVPIMGDGFGNDVFQTGNNVRNLAASQGLGDEYAALADSHHGLGRDIPQDAGVHAVSRLAYPYPHGYRSYQVYGPPTYNGPTLRGDLQPAGGQLFSFYASLGADARAVLDLPGPERIYGADVCPVASGVHEGWDCDPDNWWNPDLGGTANPAGPRPGWAYHLRDVDCYDSTVVDGTPTQLSLAALSTDGPCVAP